MKVVKTKLMNVVILGAGDSGKSTFLKQLSHKYFDDLLANSNMESNLRENILFSAKELLSLAHKQNIVLPGTEIIASAESLTPEFCKAITDWLANEQFKELLNKDGDSLALQGGIAGTDYMFNNVNRIAAPDYKPSDDDQVWARNKTTGIDKVEVSLKGLKLTVFDIGGQRNERKKWPKIFNSVGTVIYMCGLNEYDMMLEENTKKNRLHESLKIWEKLTNSEHFKECNIILLLNKADIFKNKINTHPLSGIFKNFDEFAKTRPETESIYDKNVKFVENLFKERFHGNKPYECFVLNSTSKEDWEKAWNGISVNIEKLAT